MSARAAPHPVEQRAEHLRRARVRLKVRREQPPGPGLETGFLTRNVLGWLETRLAQNTLNYIKLAQITLNNNKLTVS